MIRRLPTIFLCSFALFAPWSIALTQVSFGLVAASGLALWLSERSTGKSRRKQLEPTRLGTSTETLPWTLRAIVLFLVVQALSIVFSIDSVHALQSFRGSWTYLFPFVLYPLLRQDSRTAQTFRVLIISGGLAGAYAVFQSLTGMSPLDGEELEARGRFFMASGTLGHHLTFAGVLLPLALVAIGQAVARPRPLWIGCAITSTLGLLLSFSRLGWVGFVAGAFLFAASLGRRFFFAAVGGVTALAVAGVALSPAIADRLGSIANLTDLPRFRLWQSAVEIAKNYPLIGGGLGSWGPLFEVHKVAGEYYSTNHPHNDLLNVIVETGFIGGVAWIAIWVAFLWDTRVDRNAVQTSRPNTGFRPGTESVRGSESVPESGSDADAVRVLAIRAAVAALLVGGLAQCLATDEEVAQHWMLLVSLALSWAIAIRRTRT